MSLLGVYNTNDLTECTKVLPLPVGRFSSPDAPALSKFVNGGLPGASQNLSRGDVVVDKN